MRGTSRLSLLAVLAAFAGCESEPPPPPAPPPRPPAAKAPATPEPEADDEADKPPVYEYAYTPVGKRDPFRSLFDDAARADESAAMRDCGPLCKWELEQLRLVAVISGLSNPLAMVEDPEGRGHVVRRGTFVGKHNGKVTQIRSGEIVVSEVYKDHLGKPHINARVMKLPVEQKERGEDTNLLLATEH